MVAVVIVVEEIVVVVMVGVVIVVPIPVQWLALHSTHYTAYCINDDLQKRGPNLLFWTVRCTFGLGHFKRS